MAIDVNNPIDIITVKAPQWASDPRIPDLVELSKLQTSECFGKKYALAVALRVLHGLAVENQNGSAGDGTDTGSGQAGSVSALKEGDLSESRNTNSGASSGLSGAELDLESTSYGRELIAMSQACFSGPISKFSGTCP